MQKAMTIAYAVGKKSLSEYYQPLSLCLYVLYPHHV